MIDRDVVLDRVRQLLNSIVTRDDVQGSAVLERAAQSLESATDQEDIALHCSALARALRGIERQGKLTEDEFTLALALHEEIDGA